MHTPGSDPLLNVTQRSRVSGCWTLGYSRGLLCSDFPVGPLQGRVRGGCWLRHHVSQKLSCAETEDCGHQLLSGPRPQICFFSVCTLCVLAPAGRRFRRLPQDCRIEGGAMAKRRGLFAHLSHPHPTVLGHLAPGYYSWGLYYLPF